MSQTVASQHQRGIHQGESPAWWFLAPASILLALLSVVPMLILIRMAFSNVSYSNIVSGKWNWVGLENFRSLVASPSFKQSLTNTGIFVALVVALSMLGGMVLASVIKNLTIPRRMLQALLVLSWTLPPVVTGSAWKFLLFGDGVINSLVSAIGLPGHILWLADPKLALYSVAAVNIWATVPFAALTLRAALLDVPKEQLEAASVDGASPSQRYRYITLPALKPVLMVLTIILTVYAFRSFDFLFVITNGGPGTASSTLPFLGYMLSFRNGFFGTGAAAALLSGLAVLILAIFYVRATSKETR